MPDFLKEQQYNKINDQIIFHSFRFKAPDDFLGLFYAYLSGI